MSVLEGYIIFAFSTAIAACYLWFWPAIQFLISEGIDNSFTKRPWLSVAVYILMTSIIAPVLVFPLLSNKHGEAFDRGLRRAMQEKD